MDDKGKWDSGETVYNSKVNLSICATGRGSIFNMYLELDLVSFEELLAGGSMFTF